MLPVEQYDELTQRSRKLKSLVEFFRESLLVGLELEVDIKMRFSGRILAIDELSTII